MSQDILQFLADHASSTPLDEAQFQALRSELTTRLNAMSVDVPGSTVTVLYSGKIGDNLHSGVVAATLADADPAVRTINKTEVGEFLDSRGFKDALRDALGPPSIEREALFKRLTEGTRDASNTRVPDSLWDAQSARFVDATVGEVRTLTSGALADSVFAQTEMRRILENPNITGVDDIPRDRLVQLRDQALAAGASADDAHVKVVATVTAKSYDETAKLKIATDADGKPLLLGEAGDYRTHVDSRDFFERTPGIDGHAPPNETLHGMFSHMSTPTPAQLENGVDGLHQLRQNMQADLTLSGPEHAATRAAARTALEKLGIAGDVLALALIAQDANAAYADGDVARGNGIIRDGLLEFGGGVIGGVLAAKLVASALAPLYMTVPVIAGGLTLLAGIAGGIAGEEVVRDLIEAIKEQFGKAEITRSPLVLDLDGDGVETTSVLAGTNFDNDGNGFAEATGWVGKDDGLLVWDRNGNGKIDDGSELFGNNSRLEDGSAAQNGFAALAELDTNRDGKVDTSDAAFTQLRVWKDGDSNAIVGSGELLTLEAAGVQSLGLTYTQQSVTDGQGNLHLQAGQYVAAGGAVRSMNDVWFTVRHGTHCG